MRRLLGFFFHLPNFVRLYWSLLTDKRAPLLPKIVLVAAVVYSLSPVDLFPEIALPVVGWLDDFVILVLCLRYFIRAMPKELVAEKVEAIDRHMRL